MKCPKCGCEIKMFDLSPVCKKCGVNLMYFTQEKELTHDAKIAELEYANARIFIAKLKRAFIDGKLQITRMILTLFCICSLLIPFFSLSINFSFFSQNLSLCGIGMYDMYNSGFLLSVPGFLKMDAFKPKTTILFTILIAFIFIVLSTVAIFLTELLSFINNSKSSKTLIVLSSINIVLSAIIIVLSFIFKSNINSLSYASFVSGYGGYIVVLVNIAMITINYLIHKSNTELKTKEFDIERSELLKKIKNGEVNIDDLPLPIFESEEEKKERIRSFIESEKDGGEDND